MKNKWKIITAVSAFLVLFITVGATLNIYSQKQDKQDDLPPLTQQQKDSFDRITQLNREIPVADYNESLPTDVKERTEREKRNKARNIKEYQPGEAKRFMLTEERESNYGAVPKDLHIESAIPVKRSSTVIIGEITDAKAYLSEDKTSIYSEFEVGNPEVLKNVASESLNTENPIIVSRGGGGVRFPSGKVIYNWVLDRPMPQVGKKYLFFLDYSTETGFSIITAYELREGQVFPIDGVESGIDKVTAQFKGHQSFKGTSEAAFLNQVKEAIENKSDVLRKGK